MESKTLPIKIFGSKNIKTVTNRIGIILALGFVVSFLVVTFAAYWWSCIILTITIFVIFELMTQWSFKKEENYFKGFISLSLREIKAFKERSLSDYLVSRVAFGARVYIAYVILLMGRSYISDMVTEPSSSYLVNESYLDTALFTVAILLTFGGMYFVLTYGYNKEKVCELCDKERRVIPGEIVFYCRHCEICGKARIHRVHIYCAKELSSDCMACEMGEGKHKVMIGLIEEWVDKNNEMFSDMTVEERKAYFDMTHEERKAFRKEWRER